jgi:hypothetical protein
MNNQKTMMYQESRKTGLATPGLGKVALLSLAFLTLGFAGCCNEAKPAPAPAPEGKMALPPSVGKHQPPVH